ncbi:MAG: hypothetical protein ACPGTO_08825 [Polaribacter sp.]
MLKVVSNTTPIISLLKLNKLTILRDLYSKINIPFAVYKEIEAGKKTTAQQTSSTNNINNGKSNRIFRI